MLIQEKRRKLSREEEEAANKVYAYAELTFGFDVPRAYRGTMGEIEKQIADERAYLTQGTDPRYLMIRDDMTEYRVVLFFEKHNKLAFMGIGSSYEAARKKAEQNFPFESNDALREHVTARFVYYYHDDLIEIIREKDPLMILNKERKTQKQG